MDPWVRQKNFPVVTITNNGNIGTLSQKRFLIDASAATGTGSDYSTYGYVYIYMFISFRVPFFLNLFKKIIVDNFILLKHLKLPFHLSLSDNFAT